MNYKELDSVLTQEADTYTDPETGLTVFTASYHIKRGYCCGKKCRHCPYEPRHGETSVLAEKFRDTGETPEY